MKETISRVEKRGEELSDSKSATKTKRSPFHKGSLEDGPGSEKDRLFHQSYEVPVNPICAVEPELVTSDGSICSSKSLGDS